MTAEDRPIGRLTMLFAGVALICFLSIPLLGGRFGLLGDQQPRGVGVAIGALAIQIVIISIVPSGDHGVHTALHLASYVIVGWVVWANRHIPWLWVVGAGGLLNFVAIAANGGVMPASAGAMAAAGLTPEPGEFINSSVLEDPKLLFLGDVFGSSLPWPSNVFSVGDIVMAVGAFLCIQVVCDTRLSTRRLGRAHTVPAPQPIK